VVDALPLILVKENQAGHISRVVPHLIKGGITHLQYDDDTNPEQDLAIANLKFLLICFEFLSGLKIKNHKSEVIVMGVEPEEQARVACLLNCQEGSFPSNILAFL
jgi:hypothetical protein